MSQLLDRLNPCGRPVRISGQDVALSLQELRLSKDTSWVLGVEPALVLEHTPVGGRRLTLRAVKLGTLRDDPKEDARVHGTGGVRTGIPSQPSHQVRHRDDLALGDLSDDRVDGPRSADDHRPLPVVGLHLRRDLDDLVVARIIVGELLSPRHRHDLRNDAEQVLRGSADSRPITDNADGSLKQPRILRHERDELCIGLTSGQSSLGGVPLAEHIPGAHAELGEHILELRHGERLLGVLPIGVIDAVVVEQGDRLATGASGLGADEQHGGLRWPPLTARTHSPPGG